MLKDVTTNITCNHKSRDAVLQKIILKNVHRDMVSVGESHNDYVETNYIEKKLKQPFTFKY